MRELGNNIWLSNKGNKFFLLKRPPYEWMAFLIIMIIIHTVITIVCILVKEYFILLFFLFLYAGMFFLLFKKKEVILDFDHDKIIKRNSIFNRSYIKEEVINYTPPLIMHIQTYEDSDGATFSFCAGSNNEEFINIGLSNPQEGKSLIKIFKKKFPHVVEDAGIKKELHHH
jgi:hypothetical protein